MQYATFCHYVTLAGRARNLKLRVDGATDWEMIPKFAALPRIRSNTQKNKYPALQCKTRRRSAALRTAFRANNSARCRRARRVALALHDDLVQRAEIGLCRGDQRIR